MKINKLERSDPIYQGKNIHELVREINEELSQLADKSGSIDYADEKTKLKMGHLYQTKEINPPFFFSWEFMGGTYFPFLSPFMIAVTQIAFVNLKQKYKEWKESKNAASGAKVKTE